MVLYARAELDSMRKVDQSRKRDASAVLSAGQSAGLYCTGWYARRMSGWNTFVNNIAATCSI